MEDLLCSNAWSGKKRNYVTIGLKESYASLFVDQSPD